MDTGHGRAQDAERTPATSHRTTYWASFAVAGALVLVAVVAATVLAGRSPAPRHPAAASPGTPVFTAGPYRGRRPSTIDFATDGSSAIEHLTWSSWTTGHARATGTFEYDTCRRGCGQGPFRAYRATVELSVPAGGQFTVLVRTVAAGPTQGVTTWTYPLRWPVGAG